LGAGADVAGATAAGAAEEAGTVGVTGVGTVVGATEDAVGVNGEADGAEACAVGSFAGIPLALPPAS
jgi:hypothetical protein